MDIAHMKTETILRRSKERLIQKKRQCVRGFILTNYHHAAYSLNNDARCVKELEIRNAEYREEAMLLGVHLPSIEGLSRQALKAMLEDA